MKWNDGIASIDVYSFYEETVRLYRENSIQKTSATEATRELMNKNQIKRKRRATYTNSLEP